MHISMFQKVGDKVAQCVIGGDQKQLFEELGFVDHVDKLAPKATKAAAKTTTTAKATKAAAN